MSFQVSCQTCGAEYDFREDEANESYNCEACEGKIESKRKEVIESGVYKEHPFICKFTGFILLLFGILNFWSFFAKPKNYKYLINTQIEFCYIILGVLCSISLLASWQATLSLLSVLLFFDTILLFAALFLFDPSVISVVEITIFSCASIFQIVLIFLSRQALIKRVSLVPVTFNPIFLHDVDVYIMKNGKLIKNPEKPNSEEES